MSADLPASPNRQTRRVSSPTRLASDLAKTFKTMEDTLELTCWVGETDGVELAETAFQLTIIHEGQAIARQIFVQNDVVIGRAPSCDLSLDDGNVSRVHARISGGELIDENSANGCYANGDMVVNHALRDGDVIHLGDHELVYHEAAGAIPDTAATPKQPEDAGHFALGEMTLRMGVTPGRKRSPTAALAPPRRAYLFAGGDTGKLKLKALQFTINRDDFLIGAHESNDLQLQGFRMPRVAAIVTRGPGGFSLVPLPRWPLKIGIKGEALTHSVPLEDGDMITIGNLELRFQLGSS